MNPGSRPFSHVPPLTTPPTLRSPTGPPPPASPPPPRWLAPGCPHFPCPAPDHRTDTPPNNRIVRTPLPSPSKPRTCSGFTSPCRVALLHQPWEVVLAPERNSGIGQFAHANSHAHTHARTHTCCPSGTHTHTHGSRIPHAAGHRLAARAAVAVRPWSVTSVQLAHVAAGAGAGPSSTTGGAAHADVAGTPAPDPGAPRLFVIRARVQLAWTRRGVPSELQWSRRLWTLPVRGVHVAPRSPDPLPHFASDPSLPHFPPSHLSPPSAPPPSAPSFDPPPPGALLARRDRIQLLPLPPPPMLLLRLPLPLVYTCWNGAYRGMPCHYSACGQATPASAQL